MYKKLVRLIINVNPRKKKKKKRKKFQGPDTDTSLSQNGEKKLEKRRGDLSKRDGLPLK